MTLQKNSGKYYWRMLHICSCVSLQLPRNCVQEEEELENEKVIKRFRKLVLFFPYFSSGVVQNAAVDRSSF